jgi:hypothetical protein
MNAYIPAPIGRARQPGAIERGLRKLAPALLQRATETAGAFFGTQARPDSTLKAPFVPEGERLQCAQANVGGEYALICTLTTDRSGFGKLLPAGATQAIRLDAYRELVNCICGALLAEGGFTDAFGYLTPCVPSSGAGNVPGTARTVTCAFRVDGVWFRISLAMMEAVPGLTGAACEAAA